MKIKIKILKIKAYLNFSLNLSQNFLNCPYSSRSPSMVCFDKKKSETIAGPVKIPKLKTTVKTKIVLSKNNLTVKFVILFNSVINSVPYN